MSKAAGALSDESRVALAAATMTRHPLRYVLAAALAAVLILWAGIAYYVKDTQRLALAQAERDMANLAIAFEENVFGILTGVDQRILLIKRSFERDPQSYDLAGIATGLPGLGTGVFQIVIADVDGNIIATTLGPQDLRVNIADRPHFQIHKAADTGNLVISRPIYTRYAHRRAIQLTRRLNHPDGGFAGIVSASLDPDYLTGFFNRIDLGANGAILVFGTDGIVRARVGSGTRDSVIGMTLPNPVSDFDPSGGRSINGRSPIDGVERVANLRRVGGFDLVIAVGVGLRERVTERDPQISRVIIVGFILTLAIAGLVVIAGRVIKLRRASDLTRRGIAYNLPGVMYQSRRESDGRGMRFLYLSDRVEYYYGCTPQEAYADPGRCHASVHPDDRAYIDATLTRVPPLGVTWGRSYRVVLNGRTRWMRETTRSRREPDGTILSEGVAIDITELKEHEAEIQRARREAEEASQAKSTFLAHLTHELRTPMNAILGFAEVIRDRYFGEADDRYAAYAGHIHTSGSHLLTIINDLLDLSRLDAGFRDLVEGDFPIRAVVADALTLIRPLADERRTAIEEDWRVEGILYADRTRLSQVLINVVSNAIKYTDKGGRVLCRLELDDLRRLRVTISDNGSGIPMEDLERVFEPFNRGDPTVRLAASGTGLGLPICKHIMNAHGGTIELFSVVGEGTTIVLTLPVERCAKLRAETAAVDVVRAMAD